MTTYEFQKKYHDYTASTREEAAIGLLKSGDLDGVAEDIKTVKEACGDHILKVILETCLLSDEEKSKNNPQVSLFCLYLTDKVKRN